MSSIRLVSTQALLQEKRANIETAKADRTGAFKLLGAFFANGGDEGDYDRVHYEYARAKAAVYMLESECDQLQREIDSCAATWHADEIAARQRAAALEREQAVYQAEYARAMELAPSVGEDSLVWNGLLVDDDRCPCERYRVYRLFESQTPGVWWVAKPEDRSVTRQAF